MPNTSGLLQETSRCHNSLVVKHCLNRILRDNLRIEVPHSKTNMGRCSFRHRAAIIWNSLPEVVKVHENYEAFKKKLSKYSKVLDNICFNESSIVTFKDINMFYYTLVHLGLLEFSLLHFS